MEQIILFIFLLIFPFGQIIRIGIVQPIDVVAGIAAIWAIVKHYPRSPVFKYLENFLFVAFFSWVVGASIFWQSEVWYGLLYFARIAAYFYFFIFVCQLIKSKALGKKLISDSLIVISVASAIFGWVQFFWFPSLKPFYYFGWDEHLYRLAGTFLDPGFLGIIIVFGLLISIYRLIEKRNWFYILLSIFLIISLAFTYSRASYLAFFAGVLVISYYRQFLGKAIILIAAFLGLMLILPTEKNHVLSFAREFSAAQRVTNYAETIKIFKSSPVFGVGYDNLCLARNKIIGFSPFSSHACSGSDSSILMILATTGVIGFIILIQFFLGSLQYTKYHILYTSSVVALFIHSLFSNSLFYPWVMGYLFLLLAVSIKD